MKLRTVGSIQVDLVNDWSSMPYLTFDIDWAHDDVLSDCIDIVENYRVAATWFATHDTELMSRFRSNMSFEIGIHPNFNKLLSGNDGAGRDAAEVVDRIMSIIPEAKCVRSHSTTNSSFLREIFVNRSLTHECNTFIPAQSNISLKPYRLWSDLVSVPYSWEDDVHILYESIGVPQKSPRDIAMDTSDRGLKVFDFHPIHVFLNTESLERYERTRHLHQNPKELKKHRYQSIGTRSRFIELLDLCGQS